MAIGVVLRILVICCLVNLTMASDVKVKVIPKKPVVTEQFILSFTVKYYGMVEPFISFRASSLTVIKRDKIDLQILSEVKDGKVVTSRIVEYQYQVIGEEIGVKQVKDIFVEANNRRHKMDDIEITIDKKPAKMGPIFVLAVPDKTSVYEKEGLTVDYYLYARIPIVSFQIIRYPKLVGFIKRFYDPPKTVDTVLYQGEIYKRHSKYTARVFPNRAGKLYLDSMKINVEYVDAQRGSTYGQYRTKLKQRKKIDLISVPIEIEVKKLPELGRPKGFKELVGPHDFRLQLDRQTLKAHQTFEVKLLAQGGGCLESFDAPQLYSDNSLESFDVKSEIVKINNQIAKKSFEYIYLARTNNVVPSKKIALSYFDVSDKSYRTIQLDLPKITIEGDARNGPIPRAITKEREKEEKEEKKEVEELRPPVFKSKDAPRDFSFLYWLYQNWIIILNFILFSVVVYQLSRLFRKIKPNMERKEIMKIFHSIKKGGINYSKIHKLISYLDANACAENQKAIKYLVEDSSLSQDAKFYFLQLINECEEKSFGPKSDIEVEFDYQEVYFKELLFIILQKIKKDEMDKKVRGD